MIGFIPDTSVTMPWCFVDEANPYSDRLVRRLMAGEEALVPSLWPLEVTNALLKAIRRGRVTEVAVQGFLSDLRGFAIHLDAEDMSRSLTTVRALAELYRLTAYDAAYLELALRSGVPLATLDDDLREAAVAAGADLVEVP